LVWLIHHWKTQKQNPWSGFADSSGFARDFSARMDTWRFLSVVTSDGPKQGDIDQTLQGHLRKLCVRQGWIKKAVPWGMPAAHYAQVAEARN
jgi:hypothetical protein